MSGSPIRPTTHVARHRLGHLRPKLHFSPSAGFMNDPNGLLHDGERYHLYYQFAPGPLAVHGHICWGHALAEDLYHWHDAPTAIRETADGQAFSGCALIDHHNDSGLFAGPGPQNIVAIYTRHRDGRQNQWLAISHDGGLDFEEPTGINPVLDIDSDSFRDPKVFFHAPSGRWIMVVALARAHRIAFYGSSDLLHWQALSEFGPEGMLGIDYECPNLVELNIEGGGRRWVLIISINPGAPQGGSGSQYFVGDFDGERFVPDPQGLRLLDAGKDNYAIQVVEGLPTEQATGIGWLGNWQYCQEVPSEGWRGVMTLPRRLGLRRDWMGGLSLVQHVRGLEALRTPIARPGIDATLVPDQPLTDLALPADAAVELRLRFRLESLPTAPAGRGGRLVLCFGNAQGERLEIGYDAASHQLWTDRGELQGFRHPFFSQRGAIALGPDRREVQLQLIIDGCSLELLAQDGEYSMSSMIYPAAPLDRLAIYVETGQAELGQLELNRLQSTLTRA